MKKCWIWILLVLTVALMLLAGCQENAAPAETQPPETVTFTPDPDHPLVGTWVKAGEFDEGADYVETLTVSGDGTLTVQLDFRGEPYQILTGSYTITGQHFVVTIDAETPYTTDYRFAVDGRELMLEDTNGSYLYYSE